MVISGGLLHLMVALASSSPYPSSDALSEPAPAEVYFGARAVDPDAAGFLDREVASSMQSLDSLSLEVQEVYVMVALEEPVSYTGLVQYLLHRLHLLYLELLTPSF